jgi:protein-S-isoprenylcysteine O-methyltransferase Ste14
LLTGSAIGALWVFFLIYWIVSAKSAKKNLRGAPWWRGVAFRLVLTFLIVLAVRSPLSGYLRATFGRGAIVPPPGIAIAGVMICAAGIALAVWARRILGGNWGMPMSIKDCPELITSGPYAVVRHPIYSGLLMAMLGTALAEGLAWLVMLLVVASYFVYSAHTEERIMTDEFPSAYPAYKSRTKKLIPYVF